MAHWQWPLPNLNFKLNAAPGPLPTPSPTLPLPVSGLACVLSLSRVRHTSRFAGQCPAGAAAGRLGDHDRK
jgi:hypothetical protein